MWRNNLIRQQALVERVADGRPRPSEEAEAADLWERMLAHCPPEHRSILTLRRQGLIFFFRHRPIRFL